MNTVSSITASAALYAFIPFAVLAFGGDAYLDTLGILAVTIASSVLYFLVRLLKTLGWRILTNQRLVIYSLLNMLGFFGFVYFLSIAKAYSEPIYTLVIVESWPLMAAIIYPIAQIGKSTKLGVFQLAISLIAVLGVVLISADPEMFSEETSPRGFLAYAMPVIAMVSMALGSLAKAKYVEICKKKYDLGTVDSFFLMYAQMVPVLIIAIAIAPIQEMNNAADISFAVLIAAINAASAIFFSIGTLKLVRTSDLFIWFFAPVFSVGYFCIFFASLPTAIQCAGIGLIVGCNLLLSLQTDHRFGYRLGVISMMLMGTICVFPPLQPFDEFYDVMAVLSIFATVTLSFMLERVSTRSGNELAALKSSLDAAERQNDLGVSQQILDLFQTRDLKKLTIGLRSLQKAATPTEILTPLTDIATSRLRGLRLSNMFSISVVIFSILIFAATGRPSGWQHDFFAFCFAPSVIYALFYLFDLNNQRFEAPFTVLSTETGVAVRLKILDSKAETANTIWSTILILFLFGSFVLGFITKASG